jgi:hypothetical protein
MSGVGHVRRTINLTIDGDSFQCEVTNVTITPSVSTATATALCDDGVVQDVGVPVWTLDVDYLVDHNVGSFYRFLVGNVGAVASYSYEPDPVNAAGVLYEGTLVVIPGPAGGEAGAFETGSVSLPVNGEPSIVDPPVVPEP